MRARRAAQYIPFVPIALEQNALHFQSIEFARVVYCKKYRPTRNHNPIPKTYVARTHKFLSCLVAPVFCVRIEKRRTKRQTARARIANSKPRQHNMHTKHNTHHHIKWVEQKWVSLCVYVCVRAKWKTNHFWVVELIGWQCARRYGCGGDDSIGDLWVAVFVVRRATLLRLVCGQHKRLSYMQSIRNI